MGPWGLYNEFNEKYYQNKLWNEYPVHKNISLDTLIELVGAIGQVLCHFANEIFKSEKVWLPLNGSSKGYTKSLMKNIIKTSSKMNSLTIKT